MWFKELTGFNETSPEEVRNKFLLKDEYLTSIINNRSMRVGKLEIVSLEEMRAIPLEKSGDIRVSEIVADVKELHCNVSNKNALFQAASQFNLLEMVSPMITPEMGIDKYENDYTQGPACAISCGAGTIFRNYFIPLNGELGQKSSNQVNCLEDIGKELGNENFQLWSMQNGYALVSKEGILNINKQLNDYSHRQIEFLKGKLKVGVQWNSEVTISNDNNQIVSQVYCSALPVAYSQVESIYWEPFARVILEATYEATLFSAIKNIQKTGSNKVFLTLIGGGAFGNDTNWIIESLAKVIEKFKSVALDISIVSYGSSNQDLEVITNKYG